MDIRGRCDIKYKNFKYCNARIDTLFFQFENDYDSYKLLEKDQSNYKIIIKKFCNPYLKKDKDIKEIINMYEEQKEEEEDISAEVVDNI